MTKQFFKRELLIFALSNAEHNLRIEKRKIRRRVNKNTTG